MANKDISEELTSPVPEQVEAIHPDDLDMAEFIFRKLRDQNPHNYVNIGGRGIDGLSDVDIEGNVDLEELAKEIRLYITDKTIKNAIRSMKEAGGVPF